MLVSINCLHFVNRAVPLKKLFLTPKFNINIDPRAVLKPFIAVISWSVCNGPHDAEHNDT